LNLCMKLCTNTCTRTEGDGLTIKMLAAIRALIRSIIQAEKHQGTGEDVERFGRLYGMRAA
jgi:hypothetical protein